MMRRRILSAAFLLLLSAIAVAEDTPRLITVNGNGSVTAPPDMARITMAVQARNIEMGRARERVVAVTRDFLDLCERMGIPESKVHTTGLTIHPEYRWNDDTRRQELQGYLVRRQLEIEIEDLDDLGEVMEGAVNAGVNEVSPPRLMSSRERELHREALAAAARDAELNARVLAETLGVVLSEVFEISAAHQMVPRPMLRTERMAMASMAADAGAAETYSAGDIRFEANVTASFVLDSN